MSGTNALPNRIGLLGIGLIGKAVTRLLMAAGYNVVGYAPSQKSRDALRELGGHPVDSVAAVAQASSIIVLAVFNTDQVVDVVEGSGGILSVRSAELPTVINLSTCEPQRVSDLAKRTKGKAIFIEMPISGTTTQVDRGEGVGLVGGELPDIARVEKLLDIICPRHFRLGGIGAGAKAKLAVNLILGLNRASMAEGIAFAETLGLDARAFLDVARNSAAYSQVMDVKGRKMVERDYTPLSKVDQTLKDFKIIRSLANEANQALPFAEVYIDAMDRCVKNGEADKDNAILIEEIRRRKVN